MNYKILLFAIFSQILSGCLGLGGDSDEKARNHPLLGTWTAVLPDGTEPDYDIFCGRLDWFSSFHCEGISDAIQIFFDPIWHSLDGKSTLPEDAKTSDVGWMRFAPVPENDIYLAAIEVCDEHRMEVKGSDDFWHCGRSEDARNALRYVVPGFILGAARFTADSLYFDTFKPGITPQEVLEFRKSLTGNVPENIQSMHDEGLIITNAYGYVFEGGKIILSSRGWLDYKVVYKPGGTIPQEFQGYF